MSVENVHYNLVVQHIDNNMLTVASWRRPARKMYNRALLTIPTDRIIRGNPDDVVLSQGFIKTENRYSLFNYWTGRS